MKSGYYLLSLILISLLALSIAGQDSANQALPNSPAGERVKAYINAFNSNSETGFSDFLTANLTEKSLASRSVKERINAYHQMHDDLGRLELKRVISADENQITVQMAGSSGAIVEVLFKFDANSPHKIESMRIELAPSGDAAGGPAVIRKGGPAGPDNSTPRAAVRIDNNTLRQRIEARMAELSAAGYTGGLLVAKGGAVLLENGYGLANRERKVPFTRETVFDIGSLTKVLTRIALLQLSERGKIQLDDSLAKYFKVPANKAGITIRQLMDHKSGLVGEIARDPERITRDEMLNRAFSTKLVSEPGKEEHYSNVGYSLLAAIIESVSGQSYEQYLGEHIFKPAGMTRSGYVVPQWQADEITRSYLNGVDKGSTFDYAHLPDGPSWSLRGNGGTLSTLGDMYKFHQALQGEKLLSSKSKELLFPSPSPMAVGGNGVHFFVYRYDHVNNILVLAVSTDAEKKAMEVTGQIMPLAQGQ